MKEDEEVSSVHYISLPLQHTLTQTHLNTDVVFYCRQFLTYNSEIRDGSENYMAMCSEGDAGRRSS
jgi:pyocin large subunit-like protein